MPVWLISFQTPLRAFELILADIKGLFYSPVSHVAITGPPGEFDSSWLSLANRKQGGCIRFPFS